jgi:predicted RNA-binding Zn ribbon-like protein
MTSPASTMLIPAARADLCLAFANTRSWRGSAAPVENLSGFADLLAWLQGAAGLAPEALHPVADWARRDAKGAGALLADAIATREVIYRIFSALAAGHPVRDGDLAALARALVTTPPRSHLARLQTEATAGSRPQVGGNSTVGGSLPISHQAEIDAGAANVEARERTADRSRQSAQAGTPGAERASTVVGRAPVNDRYAWRIARAGPTVPGLLAPVLWSAGDLMTGADHARIRRCANDKCLWLFIDGSKGGTRRWCDMTSCGNRAKAHRHYLKTRQSPD